jgi:TolB-like protein/DNA-binding winged helix-turn-helix (wHTH) protein
MGSQASHSSARFAGFELDLRTGELRKNGHRTRLQAQPLKALRVLLEHPGELVTREQLRKEVWPQDTFVDFDHGLNKAVAKLRDAVDESDTLPSIIETLPRLGYRFIPPVEWLDKDGSSNTVTEPVSKIQDEGADGESSPLIAAELPVSDSAGGFRWRTALLIVAALVLVLVAIPIVKGIRDARSAKPPLLIRSIAVLPLENLSGDPAQEYFADGMTDELITMLAKNPGLRVISRTSVMQYKNVHRPLREIAQELGVEGILEGSVDRSGSRVHMTAQLIDAASDTHVWAESFDRDLSDIGALQAELAQTIAQQVGAKTSGTAKPPRRISSEAHEAYLLGKYFWFKSDDYEKSREYFQKAIDLQPDYADAWSGLADYYIASAVDGKFRPDVAMPQGGAAARKALELDDLDAEAYNSTAAFELFYQWDWEAADRDSARAIELNPSFAEGHHLRGYVLRTLNRMDEALQEQRKAMELDPFARSWALGYALLRARQFDAALKEARVRSEAQPNNADLHDLLSEAFFMNGMEKEAEEEKERSLQLSGEKELLAERVQVYRRGGFRAVLEWRPEVAKRRAAKEYVSPMEFAGMYGRLRSTEETLRYLEEAYEERSPFLVFVQSDANFDFLHAEPRYRAIIKKMGLPPAY